MRPMTRGAGSPGRADVAIVGGGPAGLLAAIAAAEAGRGVVVLEQLERPGAKLMASGGGRGNLGNTLPAADFIARFGRQGRFLAPALAALDGPALRRALDALGVPTHAPDGLHVYPAAESAVAVQTALWRRARELGVDVRLGARVTGLKKVSGPFSEKGPDTFFLDTPAGPLAARRVLLASGGRGYPALGGSAVGYDLARQAGHTVVEPLPALVPLVAREAWVRQCAGVALSPARIWIALPRRARAGLTGDVLFTHRGLSGPAVLDLSGEVAALLRERGDVPLGVDLAPGTMAEAWLARLDGWADARGAKTLATLLDRHLPKSLARTVVEVAGLGAEARPSQVSRASRRTLAELLTALPLTIVGTEGWNRAMVTRGGVRLREVDPRTLESRRTPGLFFAGEILDLDGPTGGFNLQWAFSSGHLAGRSMACAEPRP